MHRLTTVHILQTTHRQAGKWTQHCSISATASMVIYKVAYSFLWDVHLRATGHRLP